MKKYRRQLNPAWDKYLKSDFLVWTKTLRTQLYCPSDSVAKAQSDWTVGILKVMLGEIKLMFFSKLLQHSHFVWVQWDYCFTSSITSITLCILYYQIQHSLASWVWSVENWAGDWKLISESVLCLYEKARTQRFILLFDALSFFMPLIIYFHALILVTEVHTRQSQVRLYSLGSKLLPADSDSCCQTSVSKQQCCLLFSQVALKHNKSAVSF